MVWPARGLSNFISAATILRLCKAVRVQLSDPYKNIGKTSVFYILKTVSVLTFLKIVLLIIPIMYNEMYMFPYMTVNIYISTSVAIGVLMCVISCFRRDVNENFPVLSYYAASGGITLPTFRDKLSVSSSTGKNPKSKFSF